MYLFSKILKIVSEILKTDPSGLGFIFDSSLLAKELKAYDCIIVFVYVLEQIVQVNYHFLKKIFLLCKCM